jgi:hypothetical protein
MLALAKAISRTIEDNPKFREKHAVPQDKADPNRRITKTDIARFVGPQPPR